MIHSFKKYLLDTYTSTYTLLVNHLFTNKCYSYVIYITWFLIKIYFYYHKPCKVCNSVDFDIFTRLYNNEHYLTSEYYHPEKKSWTH